MNRRSFLKQAMAVFGVVLLAPKELLSAVESSKKLDPLFTGQLGEINGGCILYSDIEAAKKSLKKHSIKPIDINGEEYYMMFAHGTSYKMKV
ncbi:hypothetical protein LCGC14_1796140 [marine sediment metagenome]|uniref:Uncharacterized protein n=1 Tax=marine sediment metagenome TaxID=412755 RepID=A0A0F9HDR4_9ZZZZ|nr:hypothetical protein [Candidatus Aminicenantes bacterium]